MGLFPDYIYGKHYKILQNYARRCSITQRTCQRGRNQRLVGWSPLGQQKFVNLRCKSGGKEPTVAVRNSAEIWLWRHCCPLTLVTITMNNSLSTVAIYLFSIL